MDHDKIFVKIHFIKLYNGLLLNISKVFPKLNNKKILRSKISEDLTPHKIYNQKQTYIKRSSTSHIISTISVHPVSTVDTWASVTAGYNEAMGL